MFKRLNKRGQSTLEYAILIIIVIGALLVMQVYIKRGFQGRLKQAADDVGDQYSQGNTNVVTYTSTSSFSSDKYTQGVSQSELLADEKTTVISNSFIVNQEFEYWGN